MRHTKKKKVVYSLLVAAILLAVVILAWPAKKLEPDGRSIAGQPDNKKTAVQKPQPFNKNQYQLDVATSLWAVVNKGRVLPADYTPPDLTVPKMHLRYSASRPEMHVRSDAAKALGKMFDDAMNDHIELMLTSGYRSYSYQVSVYGTYVKTDGVAKADTYSARPGHSEHQTGLAADLEPYSENCELEQCFGTTPEGQWLAANCYKYGFIIRYPEGKDNITGYEYEPWHVRYVGPGLASQLHYTGQTLEQYFGLQNYKNYPAKSLTLKL